MKNLMLIGVLAIMLYSCSKSKETQVFVKDNGTTIVENGKGIKDSISYTCRNCEKNKVDTSIFNEIIKVATKETRNSLKYPLSFIPKTIEIEWIKVDSLRSFDTDTLFKNVFIVFCEYYYIAKNGYGNELEGNMTQSYYVKDDKIIDLTDEIKLSKLQFDNNGSTNRDLFLVSSIDNGGLSIGSNTKGQILVTSSISCIDEGAALTITLDNDEEIRLTSWNDFNCDGYSFFDPFNATQCKMLKEHKLKSITLIDSRSYDGVSVTVPKNQADYFIQLITILENK